MKTSNNKKWRSARQGVGRWLPRVAKTVGTIVLGILIIFVIFRASAPLLISSALVRSGIEDALSKWTGYRAEIEGAPTVDFWPTPRITLNQVTIREPSANGKVLGHIDSLSADFSLLQAIRGHADFHEFHFLRPTIFLHRTDAGLIEWTNEGLLANAIDRASRQTGGQVSNASTQNPKIGDLIVEDGIVKLSDERSGKIFSIDGINGDVTWPRLYDPMQAVLLGRLNGQDIKLDFSSAQPLLLFAGKNVEMTTSFSSPLISGRFRGVTNISKASSMSGDLEINVPAMPQFLKWSGESLPGSTDIKNAALSARVSTKENGLRFDNLNFTINDSTGAGVLDWNQQTGHLPKLAGTLAFDQMNLTPFLSAFSMRLAAGPSFDMLVSGNPLRQLDLDLRLSANKAMLGDFQFGDVGASLLVSGGQAKFDIGESMFEGGELTAHLEVNEHNFQSGGKLQIDIHNADFGSLITRLKLDGPLPLASGSLNLSLSTTKPIWLANTGDVVGKMHFTTGPGSFRQLNISTFRELATKNQFFHLGEVGDTAFDFNSITLDATFAQGSADVKEATIVGRNETIDLSGVVPYRNRSIALSGLLVATEPAAANELPQLPFFVGGTWPDAIISSMPTGSQKPAATDPAK